MSTGITVRVSREQAVRVLGAKIREKVQAFEAAKKKLPAQTEHTRKYLLQLSREMTRKLERAKTLAELRELASKDLMDWNKRRMLPEVPTLQVCEAKSMLSMLEMDKRKIIPIGSNSRLWSVIQDKCEVIRG